MAKRDYYQVLGVEKDAAQDKIKRSYRKLARKYHPDVNAGDPKAEEKFKEMQEAYDVLKDPEKRKKYDMHGHNAPGVDFGAGRGFYQESPFGQYTQTGGFGRTNVDDLFGEIFGTRGGRAAGPRRGRDIETDLTISLEQAFSGVETQVTLPFDKECPTCGGEGSVLGKNVKTCTTCNGSGRAKIGKGPLNFTSTCPNCKGRGKTGSETCTTCRGARRVQQIQTISVKIPQGVKEGSKIRVSGKGEAGSIGGQTGDLFINVHIQPHNIFTRDGDNLTVEAPLNFIEAILGGKLRVPTLDGAEAAMTIPPGTQSGQVFRLRGKGMPNLKGGPNGDQLVKVRITVPRRIDEKTKTLLEQIRESIPDI